jgi:hypothetical protein
MVCVWVTHSVRSFHVVIPLATTATDSVLHTSITISDMLAQLGLKAAALAFRIFKLG